MALLALGFLIVLGPLMFRTALRYAPWLAPLEGTFTVLRYRDRGRRAHRRAVRRAQVAAGRPAAQLVDILPGIVATLVLWLVAGVAFGRYLAEFSLTYVTYYAGLASAMIALVFLYWTASIFVYGGELNAAIFRPRLPDVKGGQAPVGGV